MNEEIKKTPVSLKTLKTINLFCTKFDIGVGRQVSKTYSQSISFNIFKINAKTEERYHYCVI